MKTKNRHITKTLGSTIDINVRPETIWENITNVKIEQFSDPAIFRLFDWTFKDIRAQKTEVSFVYSFTLRFPFSLLSRIIKNNLQRNVRQRMVGKAYANVLLMYR